VEEGGTREERIEVRRGEEGERPSKRVKSTPVTSGEAVDML